MSAFSRGLAIFTHQPSTRVQSLPRCYAPQCYLLRFSQSTLRSGQKKQTKSNPSALKPTKAARIPPKSTPALKQTSTLPPPKAFQSFASTLAAKDSPTLLYQAPSHAVYITGSYAFGAFCLNYAAYNFYAHYLYPPDGLSLWVPIAFGTVCFGMTCLGTWLILGSSRLIRAITAIPSTTAAPTSTTTTPLLLRLDIRRIVPLPFLKPKSILVPPSAISFSHALYHSPAGPLTLAQRRETHETEARQREYDRRHILTQPFRDFGRLAKRVARALVRVWSREGFVQVRVDGKGGVWRLDREGGWLLDEGRGLDRLVLGRSR